MQKLFLLLGVMALMGAGCSDRATDMPTEHAHVAEPKMAFSNVQFAPGDTTLSFALQTASGEALTDTNLTVTHEKLLHLIVVKSDMSSYQHLHPNFAKGEWRTVTSFAEPGTYYVYADAMRSGGDALLARSTLEVEGQRNDLPFPSAHHEIAVAGIMASLPADATYATGEAVTLPFRLTDVVSGKPIEGIEQYLGAYGHVVALHHGDPSVYIHAHPITETVTDGVVEFMTTFQEPGMYTLFAQFQVSGVVRTFPITLEVPRGSGAAESDAHHGMHH